MSKPSQKANEGTNRFTKANNKGIEFNKREKSTFNKPFVKIYHKGIESINSKNFSFFNSYLDLDKIKNRVRIEVTIKSKSDLEKYNILNNKLIDVLKANKDTLDNIIKTSLNNCIDTPKNIKIRKPKTELSPTEHISFMLITTLLDMPGMTFENALELSISTMTNKVYKSRAKKQLIKVYEENIKGLKIETKAQKVSTFFKSIEFE
jgi:hypothetical protein